jgi:hypothetical protein
MIRHLHAITDSSVTPTPAYARTKAMIDKQMYILN